MAARTLHINMLARQRKMCRAMIEFGFFPVALVMTVSAFDP